WKMPGTGWRGTGWRLGEVGVEDADSLPVGAVVVDEFLMARVGLVGVVSGSVGKDRVETHFEFAVVHVALQLLIQTTYGEVLQSRMTIKVLDALGNQVIHLRWSVVDEAKVDHVGDARTHANVSPNKRDGKRCKPLPGKD